VRVLLLALAMALPASAQNHKPMPLRCIPMWQLDMGFNTCPTGGGGCDVWWNSDGDCEWDGIVDNPEDSDLVQYVPDPRWDVTARTLRNSIVSDIQLHNVGLGDPTVSTGWVWIEQTGAFDVIAGQRLTLWHTQSATSSLLWNTVICPSSGPIAEWRSDVGGAQPAWTAPATEECLLFSRAVCQQNASTAPQHKQCAHAAGVKKIPTQSAGCGFGPGLALVLPLWWAARRRS